MNANLPRVETMVNFSRECLFRTRYGPFRAEILLELMQLLLLSSRWLDYLWALRMCSRALSSYGPLEMR